MSDERLPKLVEAEKHKFTKEDVQKLRDKMKDEKQIFKTLYPDFYEMLFGKK